MIQNIHDLKEEDVKNSYIFLSSFVGFEIKRKASMDNKQLHSYEDKDSDRDNLAAKDKKTQ